MAKDGWDEEAASRVIDRNTPRQAALSLAPHVRIEKQQERVGGWVELTIRGEPVPWGRAGIRIVTPKGKKPFPTIYTPADTLRAEERVRAAWKAAGLPFMGGRLELHLLFFQTPQKNRAPRREDWDNLAKLIGDALNGTAYSDDKLISKATVEKLEDEHDPRTVIRIRLHTP